MFCLGLDIDSLSCDAVLIDGGGNVVSWSVVPTGARNSAAIERARREVLEAAGIPAEELSAIVATGYGRDCVCEIQPKCYSGPRGALGGRSGAIRWAADARWVLQFGKQLLTTPTS